MKRIGILLTVVALIAGMVGCGDSGGGVEYDLTITSTSGGSVTIPGEGTFKYDEGAVVNLTAQADEGYQFVNWTGDIGTIGNVDAAETIITTNGNYEITANFEAVYSLTISSTTGGSVTTPGEGIFTYDTGTLISLVAEAEDGCHFTKWTGDVDTISDVNAASTNITVNGHYTVTANFIADGFEAIFDWYDLDAVRDNLVGRYIMMNELNENSAGYFVFASETANEGKGWEPIGTYEDQFGGSFDGQAYEIRNLFINRPNQHYVGLFGCVAGDVVEGGGVINNIGVVNVTVTGDSLVGSLVGFLYEGSVHDSYSIGSVTGGNDVGGLVGRSSHGSYISNCYSNASVYGNECVGGLLGSNRDGLMGGIVSSLIYSYSSGSVIGERFVGGLVGYNSFSVTDNCYSTAVTHGNQYIGGLVGYNSGSGATVSKSYSTGSVSGNSDVGGLVGDNLVGTVTYSRWDTETSGQATSDGGTGKNTTEMQDITTFSDGGWSIVAVDNPGIRNASYIWNIVEDVTYPFLSWEPAS